MTIVSELIVSLVMGVVDRTRPKWKTTMHVQHLPPREIIFLLSFVYSEELNIAVRACIMQIPDKNTLLHYQAVR